MKGAAPGWQLYPKGATPGKEGASQALDAHDPPHHPAAPGKGVHERHEKPHFKLFLTLVYTFLERTGYIAGLLGLVS